MQNSGRLVSDKRAFGYRPSLRQLGRLRAFIDNQVDFTKFADVIWGDSDGERKFPLVPPGARSRSLGELQRSWRKPPAQLNFSTARSHVRQQRGLFLNKLSSRL
eukprot:2087077-Amphidinium_carterae.1